MAGIQMDRQPKSQERSVPRACKNVVALMSFFFTAPSPDLAFRLNYEGPHFLWPFQQSHISAH